MTNRWPCPVCSRPTMRAVCARCERRQFVTDRLIPFRFTEDDDDEDDDR